MNNKFKIISAVLTGNLLIVPISEIVNKYDNMAKASEINKKFDNKIQPLYDGWAGNNGVTQTVYMDFNACYEYVMKNNSNPLRSLIMGLGASFFGKKVGITTAITDYVIGQLHGTLYYKCQEAVKLKKGVLIRIVPHKVNYGTYPTIKVAYYSLM